VIREGFMEKCCICGKVILPIDVIVRIDVEAVTRKDGDGDDPKIWD
jgi:hypothetical protein